MLTVKPDSRQNLANGWKNEHRAIDKSRLRDWPEWSHPDEHPCMSIFGLVSGLPRRERNRMAIAMMQAYFDDTGKSGSDPIFILAGFKARAKNWAALSDAWQVALDKKPKLKFLKARDAYNLKDKKSQFFGWSEKERDKRLVEFAKIVKRYVSVGMTFSIPNDDFHLVFDWISNLPHPNYRTVKNPFFLAFLALTGVLLHRHAESRTRELLEILFDEGIDSTKRLKRGYEGFVEVVRRESPDIYDLLVNKEARFADDKIVRPLQASDLLAWHYKKYSEATINGLKYADPVWLELETVNRENFGYNKARLQKLLGEVVMKTLAVDGLPN